MPDKNQKSEIIKKVLKKAHYYYEALLRKKEKEDIEKELNLEIR